MTDIDFLGNRSFPTGRDDRVVPDRLIIEKVKPDRRAASAGFYLFDYEGIISRIFDREDVPD